MPVSRVKRHKKHGILQPAKQLRPERFAGKNCRKNAGKPDLLAFLIHTKQQDIHAANCQNRIKMPL